jgi:hypothetical protein
MYVDPRTRTTATLYGDEAAMRAVQARKGADVADGMEYPAGAVLALVSWAQRDDPHWFGARIPDKPLSVEFVQVSSGRQGGYRRFAGTGLAEEVGGSSGSSAVQRTNFILGLAPVRLP